MAKEIINCPSFFEKFNCINNKSEFERKAHSNLNYLSEVPKRNIFTNSMTERSSLIFKLVYEIKK